MEYKKNYTDEEIKELLNWYNKHEKELTGPFEMNEYTHFTELKNALPAIFATLKRGGDNSTFSGQIHQYFILRDALIKAGKCSD
jgi:hypothetical protein